MTLFLNQNNRNLPAGETEHYIELKTSKVIESEKDVFVFERYKLLKFWAQSYIANVSLVVNVQVFRIEVK